MRTQPTQFLRVLGRRDVLALAFGAMVGWGWVVLSGSWIVAAGSLGAVAAFAIGAVAMILIGLTYAELAAAMPKAGGEHVYSFRALGVTGSFVCTWAVILAYVAVVAFEAVALPTVLDYLLPGYAVGHLWTVAGWEVEATWVAVGSGGAVVMTVVNLIGIRFSAVVQAVLTLGLLLAGLMLFAGAPLAGQTANLSPLFTTGAGVFAVLIMVPFMFVGFDVIPQAAEEIDLPLALVGKLLVFAVTLAAAWYVLILLCVGVLLSPAAAGDTELATAAAAEAAFGPWGGRLLVLGGLCGVLTSWNAFMVGGSRALFAMGRARMLPAPLARLHPRHRTPSNALLLIGGLSVLAPLAGRPALVWLANTGSFALVIAYLLVAVSFLRLRAAEADMPRPCTVPAGRLSGWLAALAALGLALLYLPGSPSALAWPQEWLIILAWIVLGVALHLWSRRRYGHDTAAQRMHGEMAELAR